MVEGKEIPSIRVTPVQSSGRGYNVNLSVWELVDQLRKDVVE